MSWFRLIYKKKEALSTDKFFEVEEVLKEDFLAVTNYGLSIAKEKDLRLVLVAELVAELADENAETN